MKRIIAAALACGLLSGGSVSAKKVIFNELPAPVQKTIAAQKIGDEKAITIKEETEMGQMVYKVGLKREGNNVNLWISPDGTLVRSTGTESGTQTGRTQTASEINREESGLKAALGHGEKLRVGDTPVAVQDAIKAEFGNTENIEVKRDTKDGRTVYNVELKQEGKNQKLVVAEDGFIVKNSGRQSFAEKLGLKKFTLDQLPPAAQETIRTQTGTAEIGSIKQEMRDGKTVYKVEFKEEGKNHHMWVADDGTVVQDERRATGTEVEERAGAEYANGKYEATTGKNLAFTDTPQAVQDTITAQKGEEKVEGIKINKRTKDEKNYYHVTFKKEGKNMELDIAEDGTLMPKE